MKGTLLGTSLTVASATIYFKETFNDDKWQKRWVIPTKWKPTELMGEWKQTAGKWYGDAKDKGIQTSEDARFYGLSAKIPKPFTNEGKDLVLQYTVKHEQQIDCGGAYLKLLGPDVDQDAFGNETPYQVMFGPDVCGYTKRTHVIFNYPPKQDNLLIKDDVPCEEDQLTHVYTLHVKPDNTYDVLIDGVSKKSGQLEADWDFLLPKRVEDSSQSKPQDWVDHEMMPDPEDKKPEGYDDIPALIPDAEANKPDDWDEDEDGEWEAPMIDNPEYKGDWKPKMIPNPAYKGPWIQPEVDNPDYKEDPKLYVRAKDVQFIGIEIWQVKAGTIFDSIILTDSLSEAKSFADETYKVKDKEQAMFDKQKEETEAQEKAERDEALKKAEAESKAGAESDEDEDEDDGFSKEL